MRANRSHGTAQIVDRCAHVRRRTLDRTRDAAPQIDLPRRQRKSVAVCVVWSEIDSCRRNLRKVLLHAFVARARQNIRPKLRFSHAEIGLRKAHVGERDRHRRVAHIRFEDELIEDGIVEARPPVIEIDRLGRSGGRVVGCDVCVARACGSRIRRDFRGRHLRRSEHGRLAIFRRLGRLKVGTNFAARDGQCEQ